jgi:hypothetical protein
MFTKSYGATMKNKRMSSIITLYRIKGAIKIAVFSAIYFGFSERISPVIIAGILLAVVIFLQSDTMISRRVKYVLTPQSLLSRLHTEEYLSTYVISGTETLREKQKIVFSRMYLCKATFFENLMFGLSLLLLFAFVGNASIYIYQLVELYLPSKIIAGLAILCIVFQIYYTATAYRLFGDKNNYVYYMTVLDKLSGHIFKVGPWFRTEDEAFNHLNYSKKTHKNTELGESILFLGVSIAFDLTWEDADRLNEEERKLYEKPKT